MFRDSAILRKDLGGKAMKDNQLRIEQLDTVLYNANLNPMGVPESVIKAVNESADRVVCYPTDYIPAFKNAISEYTGCSADSIVFANGSADLLRKILACEKPEKVMLLSPGVNEYEKLIDDFGCEAVFFELSEENDYEIDLAAFVGSLDSSIDMVILSNPCNPTSQLISREDIETLAAVCAELDTRLIVDEMYMEFVNKYRDVTAVPLISDYSNLTVLRSFSKFFAVPGLRISYAMSGNNEFVASMNRRFSIDSIPTLSIIACTAMLKDSGYISESNSQIYTERNLIYSAMSTNKNLRLFKPQANFMLAKILKEDVTASDIAEHCNLKGIVIRNCSNIRGLNEKYIRFCFMKPKQNDLLVNTILELL